MNNFSKKWAKIIAKRINMQFKDDECSEIVLQGLNRTGGGCPCVIESARTRDHLCPCKDAREEGVCRCGIFKKKTE